MTDLNPMSRDELRRLAALDVFGLLDEIEAEQFNRSFHDASVSTQDEILSLQAELASDTSLMPRENPDPSLRERVLDRVARAIEEEAERLAPIGSIGRARAGAEQDTLFFRSVQRTARLWRAACFVLVASLFISVFFYAEALREGMSISKLLLDNSSERDLQAMIGPDFGDFVKNPNATPVVFRPVADDSRATATVFVNSEARSVFVMAVGLTTGEEYSVRLREKDGERRDVGIIEGGGIIASARFDDFDASQAIAGATWEIVDALGNVVLTTARV